MLFPIAATAAVFVLMLVEMLLSRRNERVLRSRGAVEPRDDVYRHMTWAYPACFLAMGIEGALRRAPAPGVIAAGLAVFALSKALKLWAIHALGVYWSFRVLVMPGHRLVAEGPYHYLRHPNYVAVVGELAGVAVMLGAPMAGVVSVIGFAILIRRRIVVEERALGLS